MDGVLCDNKEFPVSRQEFRKMLEQHHRERQALLKALWSLGTPLGPGLRNLEFISQYDKLVTLNDPCLCQRVINPAPKTRGNLSIGKSFGKGKMGEAYLMDSASGEQYIIKKIASVEPRPTYIGLRIYLSSADAAWRSAQIMNPSVRYNTLTFRQGGKGEPTEGTLILKCGGFTNQSCLHMIINEILGDSPNYVYQYDAFYCEGGGYSMLDIANRGDMSNYLDSLNAKAYTGDMLDDMIGQLLPPLALLKHDAFGFIHADLKCRNVFVHDDGAGPVYRLADFDKSSIYWHGLRFHNNDRDLLSLEGSSFAIPAYERERCIFGQGDSTYTAVNVGNLRATYTNDSYMACAVAHGTRACGLKPGQEIQQYTMFGPYGFFLTFDIYTFMISCMLEPTIWKRYKAYKAGAERGCLFYDFWRGLFRADGNNFNDVEALIEDKHHELVVAAKADRHAILTEMRSITLHTNLILTIPGGLWFIHDMKDILSTYNRAALEHKRPLIDMADLESLPHVAAILHDTEAILKDNSKAGRGTELSKLGKVCLDECRPRATTWSTAMACHTNKYSKSGTVYDWDWCA